MLRYLGQFYLFVSSWLLDFLFFFFASGFCAELRTNFVTFLGDGYKLIQGSLLNSESLAAMPTLPDFLCPVTRLPARKAVPILTAFNNYQVLENIRNEDLFHWGCFLPFEDFRWTKL
jgi:hypothetical protein